MKKNQRSSKIQIQIKSKSNLWTQILKHEHIEIVSLLRKIRIMKVKGNYLD